jgi:hypothetical protein
MAIGTVLVQRGSIRIFDDRGKPAGVIAISPYHCFDSYTSTTVTVETAFHLYVYNEQAALIFSVFHGRGTAFRGSLVGPKTSIDAWQTPT